MYCIPVLAQRRREFYSFATSRFFTYCGGVWNALTAIIKGSLYIFLLREKDIFTCFKLCRARLYRSCFMNCATSKFQSKERTNCFCYRCINCRFLHQLHLLSYALKFFVNRTSTMRCNPSRKQLVNQLV